MSNEYYGATASAERVINQLLGLRATGSEQDWEIEFAAPENVKLVLDALEEATLDIDSQSALCLLLVASFEEAIERGVFNPQEQARAAKFMAHHPDVRERMRFYWIQLGRASHRDFAEKLLSKKTS